MRIAIPTHRRATTINKLTLNLLKGFDKNDIHIFISDEQDMASYKETCRGYNLILCNTDNVTDKFNYIQNYWDDGDYVFVVEDDIKRIESLVTKDIQKLFAFIESYCVKNRTPAFGVYPSSNKYFMSKTVEVGLTYIVANLFGFTAKRDPRLLCHLPSKNDYERSVLYNKVYGPIARFNFLACVTDNYKNAGGMQGVGDRKAIEREASFALCALYPDVYSINAKRKSGFAEVKMKKNVQKSNL